MKETAVQASGKTRRNGKIDLLRFVFAVIIMLHHSRYVLGDDDCVFLGGSLAVEFFFLVSGYLLAVSTQKADRKGPMQKPGEETRQYLRHRLSGFMPELVIAWCIGFVFVGIVRHYHPAQLLHAFKDEIFEVLLLKMSGIYIRGIDGVVWYLSAMMISMAVLYPLLRRHRDVMTKIVCPLAAVLILGYFCQTDGHPRNPTKWLGFVYKGLPRGFAELCLGVTMRGITERLEKIRFTRGARMLLELFEFGSILYFIRYMYRESPSNQDYFFILLLYLALAVIFSGKGILTAHYETKAALKVTGALAKYSTALFFAHIYFAQNLNRILPEEDFEPGTRLAVYICLSLANGLLVMFLAGSFRKHRQDIRRGLGRLLVSREDEALAVQESSTGIRLQHTEKTEETAINNSKITDKQTGAQKPDHQPAVHADIPKEAAEKKAGKVQAPAEKKTPVEKAVPTKEAVPQKETAPEKEMAPEEEKTVFQTAPSGQNPARSGGHGLRGRIDRVLTSVKRYQFMFEELVKRDFKQRYKRSILGMAWSILSPLLTLLVMRIIFTEILGRDIPHYTIYLFSGNIVMSYFRESTRNGMRSLTSNAKIFTKINVPKYLFLLSKNVSALVNFGLTLIVYFAFCLIDRITFTPKMFLLIYPSLCLLVTCIGIGAILSAMYVFFEDTSYLYDVVLTLLNYMSAIFYSLDRFDQRTQNLFLLNPVYVYIKYFRTIVINGVVPSPAYHLLCLFYPIFYLGIGMHIYKKYNSQFLYYL